MKKGERFRKWCDENPDHPIVVNLLKKIRKEEVRDFIEEKRKEGMSYREIGKIMGSLAKLSERPHIVVIVQNFLTNRDMKKESNQEKYNIATPQAPVRVFNTGADRSSLDGKPEYVKYLSPLALESYGKYMLKHQIREDGTRREGNNWQKGLPNDSLLDSCFRHVMDWWLLEQGYEAREDLESALSAIIFNAQARLHNLKHGK